MIPAGQQIGGYTVLRLLGRGGMGEVYLAQHRRVARRAAIKVLVPELSQNAVVLDRFFNEARAASLIRHPGIVEILDCDLYLGQAYIVMEFLEGESFGGYLYRTGTLEKDLPFFFGVSAAVASAVGAAHAMGIIHRDLKPDNIFLHLPSPASSANQAAVVKILDFGIAKLAQQDGAPSQTGTGVLLGTPAYMSPEQCRGAGRVDSRSDVYSLGCILYEALSGGPPFVREGFGDLIVAHVSEPPPPLAPLVPGIAPELEALIGRMLAKAPEHRPQTMEEVVVALRACARAAGMDCEAPLRGKIPVERPPDRIESAATQPAGEALGPSGIDTTPLGPTPRGRAGGPSPGVPAAVPLDSSGRVAAGASGPVVAPPGREGDRSGSAVPSAPGFAAGSTRLLADTADPPAPASRSTTTFSSTAAETVARPRRRLRPWAAVAGGVVVATIGGIAAVMGLRPAPSSSAAPSSAVSPGSRARAQDPAPVVAAPPPGAPTQPTIIQPESAPAAAPRAPETVRIDLQGAPPATTVEVDGESAQLPVQLPRGPELHRITFRAPGGPPRTLEIDGTRDRIIDMVVAPASGVASPAKKGQAATIAGSSGPGSRSPGAGRERNRTPERAAPGNAEKKPPASPSDREAITDI